MIAISFLLTDKPSHGSFWYTSWYKMHPSDHTSEAWLIYASKRTRTANANVFMSLCILLVQKRFGRNVIDGPYLRFPQHAG